MEEINNEANVPREQAKEPEPVQAGPAREPEAIAQRVSRHLKLSSFIYGLGVLEMAVGAVLAVAMFFVNMAGFRGYGYSYYYNMPRFSSFFSSLVMGLMVLFAFLVAGTITLGFGKMVQASEIYIQRRSKK